MHFSVMKRICIEYIDFRHEQREHSSLKQKPPIEQRSFTVHRCSSDPATVKQDKKIKLKYEPTDMHISVIPLF